VSDQRSVLTADIRDKTFKRNADIVKRKVAGELFLVPIRGNSADMQKIFVLNQVGEFIWGKLGDMNLRDICDDLVNTFDVTREQAEQDIDEFINEMIRENLVIE
jgi:hypothetical protein